MKVAKVPIQNQTICFKYKIHVQIKKSTVTSTAKPKPVDTFSAQRRIYLIRFSILCRYILSVTQCADLCYCQLLLFYVSTGLSLYHVLMLIISHYHRLKNYDCFNYLGKCHLIFSVHVRKYHFTITILQRCILFICMVK